MTRAGVAMRMSDADLRAAISRRREQLMRLSGRARRADIERVGEWLRVLVAEKERRGRVEVRAFLQMRIDALRGAAYQRERERYVAAVKAARAARQEVQA